MFYLDLFSALNRRVDYVQIGGLAISLHGIERATMDIDVTVAMTPATCRRWWRWHANWV